MGTQIVLNSSGRAVYGAETFFEHVSAAGDFIPHAADGQQQNHQLN